MFDLAWKRRGSRCFSCELVALPLPSSGGPHQVGTNSRVKLHFVWCCWGEIRISPRISQKWQRATGNCCFCCILGKANDWGDHTILYHFEYQYSMNQSKKTHTHKQHTNLMEGIFRQWLMTSNLSHQVRQWFVTKKPTELHKYLGCQSPYWKLNWKDYEQNASTKPPVDGQNPAGLGHPVMVVVDPIVGLPLYSLVNGWSHVHQQATFSGSSLFVIWHLHDQSPSTCCCRNWREPWTTGG